MTTMKRIILAICFALSAQMLVAFVDTASGRSPPEISYYFSGAMWIDVQSGAIGTDIVVVGFGLPLPFARDDLFQLSIEATITAGVSSQFVDPTVGLCARYSPLGRYWSLHASLGFGTVAVGNLGFRLEVGSDFSFLVGESALLYLGLNAFTRHNATFAWSRPASFYHTNMGLSLCCGVRLNTESTVSP